MEWEFYVKSDVYGDSRYGGYNTKREAELAIKRVQKKAEQLNDGIVRWYTTPERVRRIRGGNLNPRQRNQMQSVFGITPITQKAKKWIKANVQTEPWQWLGPTLVVEHRYIADLVAGMLEAGMITNKDFRVG